MAESERLVEFTLLGQKFAFYTAASEEEMDAILALVRDQIDSIGGKPGGTIQVGKVAVMACLNLASSYIKLQNEHDQYQAQLEALNDKLDTLLPAE
ncbi:MAG: cell division protein ZapA [Desulfocapsaceae bacterium]|jgi:cell division protein ZapA